MSTGSLADEADTAGWENTGSLLSQTVARSVKAMGRGEPSSAVWA